MPEPLVESRTGLFTTGAAPIPLAGVSIEADLSSFCARVVITQRYVNKESTPIEAVYLFPLDDAAAVCGFEAIVDGTLVVGEVKERDAAFRMYDDAMEQGHGAFLLDEERADVFQASVGNLPPGKEALLKITYVSELAVAGSAVRFIVPTTLTPRYAPAEDHAGVGRPDSEALNPPIAAAVPYGLTLSVRVSMPETITRIESPSHPVSVAMNGNTATVSLSQREAALDGDFVLSIDAAGLDRPHALVERADDGSEAVALAFVPVLGDTPSPSEIVFLVDRSGSMAGTSIEEVRNALQLCLRSMIPGCAFNIIGFGSTYQALFDKSRSYDDESLGKASKHIAALQADLGGTEILPALAAVLERPTVGTLTRQVIVLTDGAVSNTDAVLELVTRHAATVRIFAFGIGASPSRHLVNGIARAGGGAAEFIHPGERIEPKVVRQFGRLLSPALTNIRVKWEGLEVTQAPTCVPPIFAGDRLLIYGFVKPQPGSSNAKAQLAADSPAGPVLVEATIDRANATVGGTVGALAARLRIRELEEGPAWLTQRGSRQLGRKAGAATAEIVSLSTRYGVLSRETSFVAIERRDTAVAGDVRLRRIPIAIPRGWVALECLSGVAAPQASLASFTGTARARLELADTSGIPDTPPGCAASPRQPTAWLRRGAQLLTGGRSRGGAWGPPRSPFHTLVRLQRANGSWELTADLAVVFGYSVAELESSLRAFPSSGDARRAWATALALTWLSNEAASDAAEWRMLAHKARTWLDGVHAGPVGATEWMAAAEAFFRQRG